MLAGIHKSARLCLAAALFAAGFAACQVSRADDTTKAKGFALLIGIDDYYDDVKKKNLEIEVEDGKIQPCKSLPTCSKDVEALRKVLEESPLFKGRVRMLAYPTAQISASTGIRGSSPEELESSAIQKYLAEMAQAADSGEDVLLIYYSGHGYYRTKGKQFHFILPKTDFNDETTCFTFKDLANSIIGTKASVVLMLDTCNAAGGVRGDEADQGSLRKYYDKVFSQTGSYRVVVASCATDENSWCDVNEKGESTLSIFTGCLIRALEEGRQRREARTVGEVLRFMTQRVLDRSKELMKVGECGEQHVQQTLFAQGSSVTDPYIYIPPEGSTQPTLVAVKVKDRELVPGARIRVNGEPPDEVQVEPNAQVHIEVEVVKRPPVKVLAKKFQVREDRREFSVKDLSPVWQTVEFAIPKEVEPSLVQALCLKEKDVPLQKFSKGLGIDYNPTLRVKEAKTLAGGVYQLTFPEEWSDVVAKVTVDGKVSFTVPTDQPDQPRRFTLEVERYPDGKIRFKGAKGQRFRLRPAWGGDEIAVEAPDDLVEKEQLQTGYYSLEDAAGDPEQVPDLEELRRQAPEGLKFEGDKCLIKVPSARRSPQGVPTIPLPFRDTKLTSPFPFLLPVPRDDSVLLDGKPGELRRGKLVIQDRLMRAESVALRRGDLEYWRGKLADGELKAQGTEDGFVRSGFRLNGADAVPGMTAQMMMPEKGVGSVPCVGFKDLDPKLLQPTGRTLEWKDLPVGTYDVKVTLPGLEPITVPKAATVKEAGGEVDLKGLLTQQLVAEAIPKFKSKAVKVAIRQGQDAQPQPVPEKSEVELIPDANSETLQTVRKLDAAGISGANQLLAPLKQATDGKGTATFRDGWRGRYTVRMKRPNMPEAKPYEKALDLSDDKSESEVEFGLPTQPFAFDVPPAWMVQVGGEKRSIVGTRELPLEDENESGEVAIATGDGVVFWKGQLQNGKLTTDAEHGFVRSPFKLSGAGAVAGMKVKLVAKQGTVPYLGFKPLDAQDGVQTGQDVEWKDQPVGTYDVRIELPGLKPISIPDKAVVKDTPTELTLRDLLTVKDVEAAIPKLKDKTFRVEVQQGEKPEAVAAGSKMELAADEANQVEQTLKSLQQVGVADVGGLSQATKIQTQETGDKGMVTFRDLRQGKYRIRMKRTDLLDASYEQTVEVTEAGPQEFPITFRPDSASFEFDLPKGATMQVGGKPRKMFDLRAFPLTGKGETGEVTVATEGGAVFWKGQLENGKLPAQQEAGFVRSSLKLNGAVAGMKVTLLPPKPEQVPYASFKPLDPKDGEPAGQGLEWKDLPVGTYDIRVALPGLGPITIPKAARVKEAGGEAGLRDLLTGKDVEAAIPKLKDKTFRVEVQQGEKPEAVATGSKMELVADEANQVEQTLKGLQQVGVADVGELSQATKVQTQETGDKGLVTFKDLRQGKYRIRMKRADIPDASYEQTVEVTEAGPQEFPITFRPDSASFEFDLPKGATMQVGGKPRKMFDLRAFPLTGKGETGEVTVATEGGVVFWKGQLEKGNLAARKEEGFVRSPVRLPAAVEGLSLALSPKANEVPYYDCGVGQPGELANLTDGARVPVGNYDLKVDLKMPGLAPFVVQKPVKIAGDGEAKIAFADVLTVEEVGKKIRKCVRVTVKPLFRKAGSMGPTEPVEDGSEITLRSDGEPDAAAPLKGLQQAGVMGMDGLLAQATSSLPGKVGKGTATFEGVWEGKYRLEWKRTANSNPRRYKEPIVLRGENPQLPDIVFPSYEATFAFNVPERAKARIADKPEQEVAGNSISLDEGEEAGEVTLSTPEAGVFWKGQLTKGKLPATEEEGFLRRSLKLTGNVADTRAALVPAKVPWADITGSREPQAGEPSPEGVAWKAVPVGVYDLEITLPGLNPIKLGGAAAIGDADGIIGFKDLLAGKEEVVKQRIPKRTLKTEVKKRLPNQQEETIKEAKVQLECTDSTTAKTLDSLRGMGLQVADKPANEQTTDQSGVATFDGLWEGKYKVNVELPGKKPRFIREIQVTAGQEAQLEALSVPSTVAKFTSDFQGVPMVLEPVGGGPAVPVRGNEVEVDSEVQYRLRAEGNLPWQVQVGGTRDNIIKVPKDKEQEEFRLTRERKKAQVRLKFAPYDLPEKVETGEFVGKPDDSGWPGSRFSAKLLRGKPDQDAGQVEVGTYEVPEGWECEKRTTFDVKPDVPDPQLFQLRRTPFLKKAELPEVLRSGQILDKSGKQIEPGQMAKGEQDAQLLVEGFEPLEVKIRAGRPGTSDPEVASANRERLDAGVKPRPKMVELKLDFGNTVLTDVVCEMKAIEGKVPGIASDPELKNGKKLTWQEGQAFPWGTYDLTVRAKNEKGHPVKCERKPLELKASPAVVKLECTAELFTVTVKLLERRKVGTRMTNKGPVDDFGENRLDRQATIVLKGPGLENGSVSSAAQQGSATFDKIIPEGEYEVVVTVDKVEFKAPRIKVSDNGAFEAVFSEGVKSLKEFRLTGKSNCKVL